MNADSLTLTAASVARSSDGTFRGDGTTAAAASAPRARAGRAAYLRALSWAFTAFNSVRVVAYLPTLWAIVQSADSSQHSLLTWLTWLGANLTMAAWLYEQNGGRLNRAVVVNMGNSCMCATTVALISWFRWF